MIIKELKYSEEEDCGIQAISFVENPAIEKDFIYFSKEDFLVKKGEGIETPLTPTQRLLDPTYGFKYWEIVSRNDEPLLLDNSHEFCKEHAGKVYSIDEIRNFHTDPLAKYDLGWQTQSTFCQNFQGKNNQSFNLDEQIFNCRHFLKPVRDIKKVPDRFIKPNGEIMEKKDKLEKFSINFEVSNTDKREIMGVCMIPNILIYRRNEFGQEYYVFFSKETIQKLKEKYGFNRSITIQHDGNDATGNAILLDSWIYDGTNEDCGYKDLKEGSWCVKYKVLNEKLWNYIKEKKIKGFSVEILLPTT